MQTLLTTSDYWSHSTDPASVVGGTKGGGENPERAGSLGAPLRSEEDRTVFATTPVTQFPRRPPALLQVAKPQAKPVLNVYVDSFFFPSPS